MFRKDNARPHTPKVTRQKFLELDWEVLKYIYDIIIEWTLVMIDVYNTISAQVSVEKPFESSSIDQLCTLSRAGFQRMTRGTLSFTAFQLGAVIIVRRVV